MSYVNGKILRKARKDRNLTLRKAATLMEIGFGNLCDIENNRQSITVETLVKLCRFYSLSSKELIGV